MEVEQLPDLSDWRYIEVWTLEEAAMLWAAIDPIAHHGKRLVELSAEISPVQYRKALLFLRAACEAVCAGTLSFVEAWEELDGGINGPWLSKVDFPKLPDATAIVSHMTRIQQAAFLKWAQSKQIPSMRQTLVQARKAKPSSVVESAEVVDIVEIKVPESQQEPVLLLEKPSPLDTNHPFHAEEVGFAAQVWEIAIGLGAPLPGKTVKQTNRHILDTYPQFSHLSKDAKTRISQLTNWDRIGGVPPTPQKAEPTHPQ